MLYNVIVQIVVSSSELNFFKIKKLEDTEWYTFTQIQTIEQDTELENFYLMHCHTAYDYRLYWYYDLKASLFLYMFKSEVMFSEFWTK